MGLEHRSITLGALEVKKLPTQQGTYLVQVMEMELFFAMALTLHASIHCNYVQE